MQPTELGKKVTLDELAIKHGTDKSHLSHNYCPLYEKHLPKIIGNFLEIGVYKGNGIRMFKEWYNGQGKFFGLDRFLEGYGLITIAQLQAQGINAFHGSQDDMWFLETIKEQFSVISEDASHHWLSQILTFRIMFVNNIEPGGLYVCEDVFSETYWGQGIINDPKENLIGIFEKYKEAGSIASKYISPDESDKICSMIEEVNIYTNIIFIKKKNA